MADKTTNPMDEITAMKAVAEALADLDVESISRVLHWASGRFGATTPTPTASPAADPSGAEKVMAASDREFASFADLYAAADPRTDADRALVAGYWYQFKEGLEDFPSQTINSALKDLGHGVSNITKALEVSKAQSPALIMQVRKSGSTQQARKKYKLTGAGKKAVELLIGQSQG